MKILILFIWTILSFSVPASAQDTVPAAPAPPTSPETHYRFGLVIGHDQARDDLLIPMRWGGLGFGLVAGFERVGGKLSQQAQLLLPVSLMENRFGHKAYALGIEARYALDGWCSRPLAKGSISLGGQVKWDLHDAFLQSWDEEHIYWLTAYSLGPRVIWRRYTGPGRALSVEVDLPLLAAVSRPPPVRLTKTDPLDHLSHHLIDTSRNLKLTGFPHFITTHLGAALTRKWGSGRLILSYDFELSTYDWPERVITISHRFGIAKAGGL